MHRQVLLMTGAALVLAVTLIIWELGYRSKPHHVKLAVIVAAVLAVLVVSSQLYVYWARMRQLRRIPSG
jgi:uncharacterized membrane protein